MARRPDIGNVQLYPHRPLRRSDKNGYVLKFYCPITGKRVRKNSGTRDRHKARRIQRECRDRLLDGRYAASGGAIARVEDAAGRSARGTSSWLCRQPAARRIRFQITTAAVVHAQL